MNDHELGFTTFLSAPSQRRFRSLFELGPKRRHDIRALLDHSVRLDPAHCRHLTGEAASLAMIEQRLRALGASDTCFIISADAEIDGQDMALAEALATVSAGFDGTFLSCVPGRLGIFQYAEMKAAYLLCR